MIFSNYLAEYVYYMSTGKPHLYAKMGSYLGYLFICDLIEDINSGKVTPAILLPALHHALTT